MYLRLQYKMIHARHSTYTNTSASNPYKRKTSTLFTVLFLVPPFYVHNDVAPVLKLIRWFVIRRGWAGCFCLCANQVASNGKHIGMKTTPVGIILEGSSMNMYISLNMMWIYVSLEFFLSNYAKSKTVFSKYVYFKTQDMTISNPFNI